MRSTVIWIATRMLCGALAFATPALHAATFTWLGLGSYDYWDDATGNWDGTTQNPYPGYIDTNDDAVLPAMSQEYQIIVQSTTVIRDITVSGAYELDINGDMIVTGGMTGSGLTIHLGGSLYFENAASPGSATISVDGIYGDLVFLNNASAGTAAIDGVGHIVFEANATAPNASVTLTGGSLDVSQMAAPLSLNSLNDVAATPGSLALGAASLTLTGTSNQNFYGSVSGTGVLTQAGSGTLALKGNNAAFAGGLSVQAGALQIDGDFSGAVLAVDSGATLRGSGRAGAVSLIDGTLAPGDGSGPNLRVASLACSDAQITFDLDAGTHLTIDQALTVAQCPQWHITLATTQAIASGSSFSVATLSSGTDYDLANFAVTPPAGYTARTEVRDADVIVTIFDPTDDIFGNGFD